MKQETLEEAAKHNYPICDDWNYGQAMVRRLAFVKGAEWMQERMYSDEILNILDNVRYWDTCPEQYVTIIESFLEQFKKK